MDKHGWPINPEQCSLQDAGGRGRVAVVALPRTFIGLVYILFQLIKIKLKK
jgi:hypothetical protein